MNHGRSGEIDVAVAPVHRIAKLRQPAAAPYPASGDRIKKRADEKFAQQKCPEGNAFADGADDDVAGRFHEHHFEQREAVVAHVIGGSGQEKTFAAEKAPEAAAEQKVIHRGCAADIGRGCIDRDTAKLERVADGVVGEERKNVRREVEHHQVARVFLAHEADGEKREAGLHEKHQVAGLQGPCKVRAEANVANIVGEFCGKRLARNLRLIRVVGFFRFGVVRRGGIGWRGGTTNGFPAASWTFERSPVAVPDGSGLESSARTDVAAPKAICAKNSAIMRRSAQHLYVELIDFSMGTLLLLEDCVSAALL